MRSTNVMVWQNCHVCRQNAITVHMTAGSGSSEIKSYDTEVFVWTLHLKNSLR